MVERNVNAFVAVDDELSATVGQPAFGDGEIVSVVAQSIEGQEGGGDGANLTRPTITDEGFAFAQTTTTTTTVAQQQQQQQQTEELRAVMVVGQGYHLYDPPREPLINHEQSAVAIMTASNSIADISTQAHVVSSMAAETTGEAIACAIGEVEEEKEEIIDYHNNLSGGEQQNPLAGMPTYAALGSYPATPAAATIIDGQAIDSAASGSTSWNDLDSGVSSPFAAAAASPVAIESNDDSELAALKRAAAYGGSREQKPMPQPTEDLELFYARTCEYWNALAVEAQSSTGNIDIEFCMEESMRLARECYQSVRQVPQPPSSSNAHASETHEASFVEITDEYHPADLVASSAVRAEVVGSQNLEVARHESASQVDIYGPNDDTRMSVGIHAITAQTAVAGVDDSNFQQATEVHDTLFEETAEATVIDSAPESKQAAQIMWQNPPAEEAQVLHASAGAATEIGHEEFQDQKPPAMIRQHSETEDNGFNNSVAVADQLCASYNNDAVAVTDQLGNDDSLAVADQLAEVVGIEDGVRPSELRANGAGNNDSVAVADQLAEVVGIEDDVHPAELSSNDAEAQVVGADFSYVAEAIGSPTSPPPSTRAIVSTPAASTAELSPPSSGQALVTPITTQALNVAGEAVATPSGEAISTPVPSGGEGGVENSAAIIEPSAILIETVAENEGGGNAENGPQKTVASQMPPPSAAVDDDHASNRATSCFVEDERAPRSASGLGSGTESTATQAGLPQASENEEQSHNVPDWLRDSPAPDRNSMSDADRQATSTSVTSERSGNSQVSLQYLSEHLARSTGNVMEALFGDKPQFSSRKARSNEMDLARCIMPRTLLPWSVIHSTSNNMWIATLQTNQKALDLKNVKEASKSLRAFSLPTEAQAICLAKSWTPPRMHPFNDNPQCHICQSKFAVFRRPCHCRNCGVCICKNNCSVQWPSKMIPESYNIKKENTVSVCKSCDWLCHSFRLALLEGQFDKAVALHATSNVNLTSPFANVKGEEFFAVHCAVLGKNLKVLRWLVDEHCCPIKSVRVNGKAKDNNSRYTAIVTSKGRTLLGIAMENESVDIMRYLVVTKGIAISGEKDVTPGMLIRNLDKVLRLMPETSDHRDEEEEPFEPPPMQSPDSVVPPIPPSAPRFDDDISNPRSLSEEARDFGAIDLKSDNGREERAGDESHDDECIICFDNKIDCVATPCGHQIICLECSKNISRCPVCAQDCNFLRVFKA